MTPLSNRDAAQMSTEKTPVTRTTGMPGRGDLPPWESFPLPDRRLLVSAIVQTARRQVQGQPADRPGVARG
jgi:hypothetical protein